MKQNEPTKQKLKSAFTQNCSTLTRFLTKCQ